MSTKLILYPREYNKRGDPTLHSVMGITREGRRVNVKLRISESFSSSSSALSIAELSKTDRKARTPAISTVNNGPDNREGVILFSQVNFEKHDKAKSTDHYVAGWANVICEDSDSPDPIFGIGRIKIKSDSAKIREMRSKLNKNLSDADRRKILEEIENPANFEFSTIIYTPENQIRALASEINTDTFSQLLNGMNEARNKGLSYGFYVIRCNTEYNPVPNMSKEHLATFSAIYKEIQEVDEFLKSLVSNLKNERGGSGAYIFIPCYKINSTINARSYLSLPDKVKMVKEVFYNPEGYARVNPVVCKPIILNSGAGMLFDRTYPLDYLRMNLDLVGTSGREDRVYASSISLDLESSHISSLRIGLVSAADMSRFFSPPTADSSVEIEQAIQKEGTEMTGQSYQIDQSDKPPENEELGTGQVHDDLQHHDTKDTLTSGSECEDESRESHTINIHQNKSPQSYFGDTEGVINEHQSPSAPKKPEHSPAENTNSGNGEEPAAKDTSKDTDKARPSQETNTPPTEDKPKPTKPARKASGLAAFISKKQPSD